MISEGYGSGQLHEFDVKLTISLEGIATVELMPLFEERLQSAVRCEYRQLIYRSFLQVQRRQLFLDKNFASYVCLYATGMDHDAIIMDDDTRIHRVHVGNEYMRFSGFHCDEIIRIACRFKNLRQVLESLTWNKRFRNIFPWHPKCWNRMSKNDPQTLLF
ncbi:hypothetical protein TNCT_727561 [Trichonephila clavata]|uniref:Uncharacterized protein n=1 Tax=Trichonephila clavata TaxID=2740835 RepID=A0A8X6HJ98_TRICU|nr:hypothetical protein TNCT_727561 [Trichonephila clavata]